MREELLHGLGDARPKREFVVRIGINVDVDTQTLAVLTLDRHLHEDHRR
jgi:hypothetical protein